MIYRLKEEAFAKVVGKDFCRDLSYEDQVPMEVEYVDKNYDCMPLLPRVLDSKVHAISFFSGAGGLDIGAQMAGVKVISSLDFEKDCVATLRSNKFFAHSEHLMADIRNVSAKDYEEVLRKNNPEKLVLIGGPPCQPFSKAGYWKTNECRLGPADPRNMMGSYLGIIKDIRPDGFVIENVESILHPKNVQVVDDLKEKIAALGYEFLIYSVNAVDYGVPQKRKRVFIVASRKKFMGELRKTHGKAEEINKDASLKPYERVIDWIGKFDCERYVNATDIAEGKYFNDLLQVPPGANYIALTARRGYENPRFIAGKRYWSFLLKLHPLMPSWTIIASPGHWEGPFHWNSRRLRLEEIAAIQTFPQDYKFTGSPRSVRKQIGNAVPCLLGKEIVDFLRRSV